MDKCITIQLTRGYETVIDEVDADLAELTWHVHVNKNGRPYAQTNVRNPNSKNGFSIKKMHTIIMERMLGRFLEKGEQVDHINNSNSLDNRRSNLRLASHGQNMKNKSMYKRNKSGYKGVYYFWKKYRAQIQVNGKKIMLGSFDTPEEAHEAYCKAAKLYHGEFARFE